MIFVNKGDTPVLESQIHKKTQRIINCDWPEWKRERSIRLNDDEFNAYMNDIESDTDTNRQNNIFNQQLLAYTQAVARLAQYVVAEGRDEVREMQPTGEQVYNEDTMEMEDVMQEVIVQTAIDPVDATVEVTTYDEEDNASVQTIVNPLITQDEQERVDAQATIDATPQTVIDYQE